MLQTFEAVSCKSGKLLWKFQDGKVIKRNSNLYTPQYIDDMDGDHVPDILVSHGGDPLAEPRECTQDTLVLVAKYVRILGPSGKVCQNSLVLVAMCVRILCPRGQLCHNPLS